jgi:hypothetical protein
MYRTKSMKIRWKESKKDENSYKSFWIESRSKNKGENNKTLSTKSN